MLETVNCRQNMRSSLVAVATCVGVGVGVYALDCYSKVPLLAAARRRLKRLARGPALRVALGSTNPGKLKAVEAAFTEWTPELACDVGGFATSSGVPDQPMGLEESLLGAKNRALAAFDKQRQLDLLLFGEPSSRAIARPPFIGIGLESGLVVVDGATIDTCACAIFDGTRLYVGFSSGWAVRAAVRNALSSVRNAKSHARSSARSSRLAWRSPSQSVATIRHSRTSGFPPMTAVPGYSRSSRLAHSRGQSK